MSPNNDDDAIPLLEIPGIRFVDYKNESQLEHVMSLVGRDLSEPYSSKCWTRRWMGEDSWLYVWFSMIKLLPFVFPHLDSSMFRFMFFFFVFGNSCSHIPPPSLLPVRCTGSIHIPLLSSSISTIMYSGRYR